MSGPSVPIPPEAVAALARGEKIEAIKLVRAAAGCGLKEAKDAVDACVAADPTLRARFDEAAGDPRRALLVLAVLGLAAALGAWLLLGR